MSNGNHVGELALSSIILIHPAGPDRNALASLLGAEVQNLVAVSASDALRQELAAAPELSEPLLFVIHEDACETLANAEFLKGHPVYVLGCEKSVSIPTLQQRFAIPYFPVDVLTALRTQFSSAHLLRAPERPTPHGALLPDAATGELLRALAHGLKNPLAGADGWLQLLMQTRSSADESSRPLRQVRGELQRLTSMLHAMALLGSVPSGPAPEAELVGLLQARRRDAEAESYPLKWDVSAQRLPVRADPAVLDTALKLLIGSFLDERTRVRELELSAHVLPHGVAIVLREQGDLLKPLQHPAGSLAALLHDVRPARALAWALLVKCAEDCGGAVAVQHHDGCTTLQLTLRHAEGHAESSE
ncbi:MAG: hypothetical protein EXS14_00880 [Planctomycetes bacterium]|nr:hypothetical protein [Planctomycetota bacterium]